MSGKSKKVPKVLKLLRQRAKEDPTLFPSVSTTDFLKGGWGKALAKTRESIHIYRGKDPKKVFYRLVPLKQWGRNALPSDSVQVEELSTAQVQGNLQLKYGTDVLGVVQPIRPQDLRRQPASPAQPPPPSKVAKVEGDGKGTDVKDQPSKPHSVKGGVPAPPLIPAPLESQGVTAEVFEIDYHQALGDRQVVAYLESAHQEVPLPAPLQAFLDAARLRVQARKDALMKEYGKKKRAKVNTKKAANKKAAKSAAKKAPKTSKTAATKAAVKKAETKTGSK